MQLSEIALDLSGGSRMVGSATDKLEWHSYMPVYDRVLAPYRDTADRVLEVGVQGGGSLCVWERYFSKAVVTGIDLAPRSVLTDKSAAIIHSGTFRGRAIFDTDAYSAGALSVLSEAGAGCLYDVIIDDGPHTPASQMYFAMEYPRLLAPGGIMVVEDVISMDTAESLKKVFALSFSDVVIEDLREIKGRSDDIMVIATGLIR